MLSRGLRWVRPPPLFSFKNREEVQRVDPEFPPSQPALNRRGDAGVDALARQRPLVDCPLSEATPGVAMFPSLWAGSCSHVKSKTLALIYSLLWTRGVRGFLQLQSKGMGFIYLSQVWQRSPGCP